MGFTVPLAAQITVGRNVQVSAQRSTKPHDEVLLAIDPTHAGRMLACSIYYENARDLLSTIVYVSNDDGESWAPTLATDDSVGRFTLGSDPTCAYGLDGTAYFGAIAAPDGGHAHAVVYRSANGGRAWSRPLQLGSLDREYLTVDQTTGPYRGRVYLVGVGVSKPLEGDYYDAGTDLGYTIDLYRSVDGGKSFLGPVAREVPVPGYVGGMGDCAALSSGALVCVFIQPNGTPGERLGQPSSSDPVIVPRTPSGSVRVIRSDDGGESLGPAVTVSSFYENDNRWPTAAIPRLTADTTRGPFRDRLYVVWPDLRSGRREVLSSYSADSGKTWSKPTRVNDDPVGGDTLPRRDDHDPVVAVNKDGVVGVLWYDRRETTDFGWYARFSVSLDGGATWTPSVRVSERPHAHPLSETVPVETFACGVSGNRCFEPRPTGDINLRVHLAQKPYNDAGETTGLAADATGVFHALWVDNRTGVAQVWTAPISVAGRVAPDLVLTGLTDVSHDIALDVANTSYDRRTSRAAVDVRARNTSGKTISGPLKVLVTSLTSELGSPEVVGADNGRRGVGAVWELRSLATAGTLRPDATANSRRLEFVIPHAKPLLGDYVYRSDIVDFDVRIYGRVP